MGSAFAPYGPYLGRDKDNGSLSVGSGGSADSAFSACSYTAFGPRRGRKRPRTQSLGSSVPDDSKTGAYGCMKCPQRFTTKYAQKRHSQSIHEPQQIWVCYSNYISRLSGSSERCIWCPQTEENTKPFWLCLHPKLVDTECQQRPLTVRTFYRRDLLLQHFRGWHKAAENSFAVASIDRLKE
jgi:hypothetical protein